MQCTVRSNVCAFLLVAVAKMRDDGTGCFSWFDKPDVWLADGVISKYTTGMVNNKHVTIKYTWFSWNSVKRH